MQQKALLTKKDEVEKSGKPPIFLTLKQKVCFSFFRAFWLSRRFVQGFEVSYFLITQDLVVFLNTRGRCSDKTKTFINFRFKSVQFVNKNSFRAMSVKNIKKHRLFLLK